MKKEKTDNVNHNVNRKTQELVNSLKDKDKIKILFVCLGNICRSPAAQGVFQSVVDAHDDTRFYVDSAGTGDWHIGDLPDKRMRVHANRRGYDLTHRARQFRPTDFDDFDLILVMDESNRRNVANMAQTPQDEIKIVPMASFLSDRSHYDHIPDPYYEGSEGFELVLDLLEDSAQNLYNQLK